MNSGFSNQELWASSKHSGNRKNMTLYCRSGSVVATLSFSFYYAQHPVEQTQLTWGMTRVNIVSLFDCLKVNPPEDKHRKLLSSSVQKRKKRLLAILIHISNFR